MESFEKENQSNSSEKSIETKIEAKDVKTVVEKENDKEITDEKKAAMVEAFINKMRREFGNEANEGIKRVVRLTDAPKWHKEADRAASELIRNGEAAERELREKTGFFRGLKNLASAKEGRRMIAEQTYKTLTTVFGVKTFADIGGALFGKGDIYKYIKEKGELAEEKEEITEALQNMMNIYKERFQKYESLKEGEKIEKDSRLAETVTAFKEKIKNAHNIPEGEKRTLQWQLANIMTWYRSRTEEINLHKNKEVKEVLTTYLQTKIKGTQIARDAVNTALTATGLWVLRGGAYLGLSAYDRLLKTLKGIKKAQLAGRWKTESGAVHLAKDLIINSAKETLSAIFNKKFDTRSNLERGRAIGEVLRLFGVTGTAAAELVSGTVSATTEKTLDNLIDSFRNGENPIYENYHNAFDKTTHSLDSLKKESLVDTAALSRHSETGADILPNQSTGLVGVAAEETTHSLDSESIAIIKEIKSGDTLWRLTEKALKDSGEDSSPETIDKLMDEIRENGINPDQIRPGETFELLKDSRGVHVHYFGGKGGGQVSSLESVSKEELPESGLTPQIPPGEIMDKATVNRGGYAEAVSELKTDPAAIKLPQHDVESLTDDKYYQDILEKNKGFEEIYRNWQNQPGDVKTAEKLVEFYHQNSETIASLDNGKKAVSEALNQLLNREMARGGLFSRPNFDRIRGYLGDLIQIKGFSGNERVAFMHYLDRDGRLNRDDLLRLEILGSDNKFSEANFNSVASMFRDWAGENGRQAFEILADKKNLSADDWHPFRSVGDGQTFLIKKHVGDLFYDYDLYNPATRGITRYKIGDTLFAKLIGSLTGENVEKIEILKK